MPTLSYTDLRQNLATVLDDVVESRAPVTITRQKGRGNVVMLAEEEFVGWQETVHLLASPANATRLIGSLQSALCGNVQERDLVPAAANPEP